MVEDIKASAAAEKSSYKHSGEDPSESPYYNRIFWASYKGQSRGLWGGLLLGAGLGTLGGLAIGVGAAAFGVVTGAGVVGAITGISALAGMMYAKQVFTLSGAVAGAVAAGMEISEEREQERGEVKAMTSGVDRAVLSNVEAIVERAKKSEFELTRMATGEKPYIGNERFSWLGRKHHGEGERPFFFAGVGLAGAAIGALAGGLIAFIGGDALLGLTNLNVLNDVGLTEGALKGTVIAGSSMIGASYGINRHHYRDVFDVTNKLYDGDLLGKTKAQSVAVEKVTEVASSPAYSSAPQVDAPLRAGWKRLDNPDNLIASAHLQEQGRLQEAPSKHDIIH